MIIGINYYQDPGITDLKGSVADAWIFYHYLASPQGGQVDPRRLKLLLNQEATRTEVEGAIGNFLSQSCPQDQVIIYFAGHGAPEPGRPDEAFLLVHDTQLGNMVGSAISMQRLPEFLKWRTDNVGVMLLIVDACHSGNIIFPTVRGVRKPPKVEALLRSQTLHKSIEKLSSSQKKWSVISAASADQYAGEIKASCMDKGVEYVGGVFTCRLLEALNGASDRDQDQALTLAEVYQYVAKNVKKDTAGMQTPTLSGSVPTDLPFFRVPLHKKKVEIPSIPQKYLIEEFKSSYRPYRWVALGLTVATGVASLVLNIQANQLTREVNDFLYRQQTERKYDTKVADRDAMVFRVETLYSLTGALASVTLALVLLEYLDHPIGRKEVYRLKPWFTVPPVSATASFEGGALFEFKF